MKAEKKRNARRRPKRLPVASTDAERCLWDVLRDRQIAGARFMRRFPMGRLVIDFVSRERRLAVVIDGGRHSYAERDSNRDRSLQTRGYRILRFHEDAVLRNPERIRDAIAEVVLETSAHPDRKQS